MTQLGSPFDSASGPDPELVRDDATASDSAPGATPEESAPASGSRGLTESITSTAHTPGPAGLFYADVPNRIMALIIDIIVLSIIGFLLVGLLGGLVAEPGALDSAGGELDILAFLVLVLLQLGISFAYFGYFWTATRATPGMKLLGLRIGDEADGHSIGWGQAFARWLLLGIPSILASLTIYVPDLIAVLLGLLGASWLVLLLYTMAQSPTKQGLQDRYAHTILVKVGRRPT